jgi:hypothetical protein
MFKSCMLFERTFGFTTTYHHKRTVSSSSIDMGKYLNTYDMVGVQACFCMDGLANLVSSQLQVVVHSSIHKFVVLRPPCRALYVS